jgi:transposase
MAKHQHYDYKQSVIESIFLEDQLVPGTLEYATHYIVEERLDMSAFDARYKNDTTGRKTIDPKLLLKIVLYGYSRGMISSRSLEYACQKITTFMALACNRTPDHSTIASFVSSIDEEVEDIFTMVLMICHEERLLGGTHFSIDG